MAKRYCVSILTPAISPMYDEIRYDHEPYHFDTERDAARFMRYQRRFGRMTTKVMDMENLPF